MNRPGEIKYPHLFTEGKINNLKIENRTVMSAMGCSASPGGYVNDAVINHYVERAKGGIGLIIVEVTCVDAPQGLNSADMLRIDHDHFIPGMTKLAAAIHKAGAKCLLQISHTGRGAKRKITGLQPVGPSPVAMQMMYIIGVENETPRELSIPEIQKIEDKYAQAALRAKEAGFDGVQVHSTGYYLGAQFLSTESNRRTDEYGGTPENRIRFHGNVIRKIRELCGNEFVVTIKPSLLQGDNITIQDGMYFAVRFAQMGYDAIEVMAGSATPMPTIKDLPATTGPEGQLFDLCSAFKNTVRQQVPDSKVQFISGGRAYEPNLIEGALAAEKTDFVFMGKGVFVEPRLVECIREDRYDEARPCIGCGLCMTIQLDKGEPGRCSGNAVAGRGDQSYALTPADPPEKVVVVGGGIAGVEAARIAAKRGHDVTLFEKSGLIGGQLHDAMSPPHKDYLKRLVPYLSRQLEVTGVDVRLNTAATADSILALNPGAVIVASGVSPAKLPIPGFDLDLVVNAKDVLRGRVKAGKKALIVGGGVVGCETAEFLAAEGGHEVVIVELLNSLATKMLFGNRCVLLVHLEAYGIKTYMESLCKEIKENGVIIREKDGREHLELCDTVIISVGDRPDASIYQQLKGKVDKLYNIGDSSIPDSFAESVAAGYYAGAMV